MNVRFVLFGMVGALGVGVHLLILRALLGLADCSFAAGQAMTTFIVMILNFVLNNSVTYRDRRLRGWRFWGGLLTFCLACGLGVVANVAIANEAFHHGVPWVLAAITRPALLSGVELRRYVDDDVAAGAALERTARQAAHGGSRDLASGAERRRGRCRRRRSKSVAAAGLPDCPRSGTTAAY